MRKEKIAIITARCGSKRIPKKNIKNFCGRPIIEYSINAAIESNLFDVVMVSTDSKEIADIAKKCGAEVPFFRSEKNSNDYATTIDVIQEVLNEYEKQGYTFETVCCIYPTAPFITSKKIISTYDNMIQKNGESALTVVKYSFPPQRSLVIRNGNVKFQYPQYCNTRSQDLEDIYHDCGQMYFCKVAALRKYNTLITPNCIPFIVPEEEVQDIDNYSDWNIAELKYSLFVKKEN